MNGCSSASDYSCWFSNSWAVLVWTSSVESRGNVQSTILLSALPMPPHGALQTHSTDTADTTDTTDTTAHNDTLSIHKLFYWHSTYCRFKFNSRYTLFYILHYSLISILIIFRIFSWCVSKSRITRSISIEMGSLLDINDNTNGKWYHKYPQFTVSYNCVPDIGTRV